MTSQRAVTPEAADRELKMLLSDQVFVVSRLTRFSCFRRSGGQPDEPAAADRLHRGRGAADLL